MIAMIHSVSRYRFTYMYFPPETQKGHCHTRLRFCDPAFLLAPKVSCYNEIKNILVFSIATYRPVAKW
jgi:hypothetical protein